VWKPWKSTDLDFFSFIDVTNDAQGDQKFYGFNLTPRVESFKARYDLGFFYRSDKNGLTAATGGISAPEPKILSLRAEQGFKFAPDFKLTGEFVYQWGDSNGAQSLTTNSVTTGAINDIKAFGGHITADMIFQKPSGLLLLK
jgi:hypothetical protein